MNSSVKRYAAKLRHSSTGNCYIVRNFHFCGSPLQTHIYGRTVVSLRSALVDLRTVAIPLSQIARVGNRGERCAGNGLKKE